MVVTDRADAAIERHLETSRCAWRLGAKTLNRARILNDV